MGAGPVRVTISVLFAPSGLQRIGLSSSKNPKARSDRRSKRSDPKIPGKSLSSDQGEFLVTQDDPIVGMPPKNRPLLLIILTAILTLRHQMAGKICSHLRSKSHHVIRLGLDGR